MARFFPVRSQCQFDTPGKRRFAERLEKLLEDDYLCWNNVQVGPKACYPDFVVSHPRRGILMLAVKDSRLATFERGGISGFKASENRYVPFIHWTKGEAEADEAGLLCVAMTRAIDRLAMTYQENSDFTKRVQDAIGRAREGTGGVARSQHWDAEVVIEHSNIRRLAIFLRGCYGKSG